MRTDINKMGFIQKIPSVCIKNECLLNRKKIMHFFVHCPYLNRCMYWELLSQTTKTMLKSNKLINKHFRHSLLVDRFPVSQLYMYYFPVIAIIHSFTQWLSSSLQRVIIICLSSDYCLQTATMFSIKY